MKLVSFNVNGIRSAMSKGFNELIQQYGFDVICLQEVKANRSDVDTKALEEMGYHIQWFSAQKKGYSGVAILSKEKPIHVEFGQKMEQSDLEGRVLLAEFEKCVVLSLYFPSGTSGEIRQDYKYVWLKDFEAFSDELKTKYDKPILLCGDFNIAHEEIDIHNPKSNKNSSGFLPEERNWFTNFIGRGWVDSYRYLYPDEQKYSWWSFRANARANNKGWRIDYILISQKWESIIKEAELLNDVIMSDHCPVSVKIEL